MRQIKIIVALVLMLLAAGLLFARYYHPAPGIETRPHTGIGEALAEQVVKMSKGGRLVLIAPDTSLGKFPGAAAQLQAFHTALRRANLSVTATNIVKIDPNRVLRAPAPDFSDLLRKLSDADVVVSLLGPPVLAPEQKARIGEKHARVIAVCAGDMPRQVNLKAIFAENFLHAAIISRSNPGLTPPGSDRAADWFKHYFQWVTPQNLGDLPESLVK